MFGIKFIKADPSTYLIKSRNGRVLKEGFGLSFFYHAPSTSLVSVPMGSEDIPFIFNELTGDFQEVTIQGQVTCNIADVQAITQMLNYTLNARGEYVSEDPKKLSKRIINMVQVSLRKELARFNLFEAISSGEKIAETIGDELKESSALKKLGIEIIEFSIACVKPNKETARALEAGTREMLLKQADDAIYLRRNAAIEQERIIKENELKTDISIEEKKREMREAEIAGKIVLEKQNEELVTLLTENSKKEADAKAYAIETSMAAISKIDSKTIQALAMVGMDPAQLIATSFRDLSENADKIGQLNITPDLLTQLMKAQHV
jgi:hypothetical protein